MQATRCEVIRYIPSVVGEWQMVTSCNLSSSIIFYVSPFHNKVLTLTFTVTVGAIPASFGQGSGPVFGGIYCRGTESNLTQCSGGSVGQLNCHHGRDVGVICQGRVGLGVV